MSNKNQFLALNELRDITHRLAKSKGWWDKPEDEIQSAARFIANTHGELSELWEAARKGQLEANCDKLCAITCEQEELADIIIRVLDYCGSRGIDIAVAVESKHAFNASRPHRHGGKLA